MEDKKPLIQLAEYRRQNGLKQSDVAKIFDTSPSYVSLVETGNAKLSKKSLDNFWDSEGIVKVGLIPAYDRLVQLASALSDQGKCKATPAYPNNDTTGQYEPFEHVLTRDVVLNIKYGIAGISDAIVNDLQIYYDTQISKEWLMSGVGEMFIDNTKEVLIDCMTQLYKNLDKRLNELEGRLDTIHAMLEQVLKVQERE